MGFPTFTFETDDEQFVPGSFQNLNDRLEEEMDVMRYLINNVWYWRARLNVNSLEVTDNSVMIDVANHGQASTSNATLQHVNSNGEVVWTSEAFTVNATNWTSLQIDISQTNVDSDGTWQLYYQKRVINASKWVTEPINSTVVSTNSEDEGYKLFGYGIFNPLTVIFSMIGIAAILRPEDEEITDNCDSNTHDN